MAIDNRPCFIRIFFAHFMTEKLKIPPQFVKDYLEDVSITYRAILTGPSGVPWAVETRKAGEAMFLEDGWSSFVEDNLMQDVDFVLFKYDGDSCFTVEIFDKSGVQRPPQNANLGSSCSGRMKRERCEPEEYANAAFKEVSGRAKKTHTELSSDQCQPGEISEGKRAVVAVKEEAESFASQTFSSQFPFFKMIIKNYNVRRSSYTTSLPKPFTNKHFPKDKNSIILRSVQGKAFEVDCRAYNGRYFLGKGWTHFIDENQLKVGDVCLFELVGEMEMQYRILNK